MTGPVEERAYLWPRRYVFGVTLAAIIIIMLFVLWLVAGPGAGRGRASRYGRWVIDLAHGWRTERLDLEPLAVAHATELAPLLDDPRLHEFIGGAPVSAAALADRYRRLERRRSPGGDQG